MIPLPQPFLVIPPDGSDPIYIHEAPPELQTRPMLGIALVDPRIAQLWLHAGQPVFYPVVMLCEEEDSKALVAGQRFLRAAVAHSETAKPAAVVKIGATQADTAVTAAYAMRQAFDMPQEEIEGDNEAIILSDDGGVVLGGASELWDLRKPKVMIVLVIKPEDAANPQIAAAPFN